MKNKKGFTLIELLSVIVLLGLLLSLLFPAISKYIIQTKDETYSMYEADMKTSAKNMMTECIEKNDDICIPKAGYKKKITLSELISRGYTDRLRDPEDDSKECDPFESFVVVENDNTNVTNLKYNVCLVCGSYKTKGEVCDETIGGTTCPESEDHEAPVCGVAQGESKIWTNKNREIIIGCSDDCSGCVQDTFTKVFEDSREKGTITIADNVGKTKECEVNVYVDKAKPTCELEVEGNLGETGWYNGLTKPKVRIKTKDDNLSGIATYGIGTSKNNYDFNKEEEYEVKEGITTVYGYVKDKAGNVGTCKAEIKYDRTVPVIKTVDYGTQVYPKEDIASKTNNIIKLNEITGEYGEIYGIYIYMATGTGGTATVKEGSTVLSTITIPSSEAKARNYFE